MSTHIGRSWVGTDLEDTCPCPKEPCGLVDTARAVAECTQHPVTRAKTIRQSHNAEDCPGLRAPLEYEQLDRLVDEDPIALRDAAWAEVRRLRAEAATVLAERDRLLIQAGSGEVEIDQLREDLQHVRAERDSLAAQLAATKEALAVAIASDAEARAQLERARPVLEAAVALVGDWAANRSTHGGPLRVAVGAYQSSPSEPGRAAAQQEAQQ